MGFQYQKLTIKTTKKKVGKANGNRKRTKTKKKRTRKVTRT